MNGDQLQYEIDNASVPLEQRQDYPFCSFDADDWAKAFCLQNPGFDVDVARAWFAGALMRGFDEQASRQRSEVMQFIGWLSGDIPELHRVEVPRLAESWDRFQGSWSGIDQREADRLRVESGQLRAVSEQIRTDAWRPSWWRRLFGRGVRS